jgi:hypothetical protein
MFSVFVVEPFFSIALNNNLAASFPISNAGCVTVVNEGLRICALGKFEKLINLSRDGILIRRSLQTE